MILLSFILLGLLFVITVTLSRTYEARKEALVGEWAQEGDSSLAAGKPTVALEDYRNALAYDPESPSVQLHLAQSLLADGRFQEAHTYFLNLWEHSQGSGILNLELARTSARMGAMDQAILYYRTAILGGWDDHPDEQRRSARLELCEYLVANGRTTDAQAEIVGLAADLPPEDASAHAQVGSFFMRVAAPVRALAQFEQALKSTPNDPALNELAGQAAYVAADYAKAEKYLTRALRQAPSDQVREMLLTVHQIQDSDPFMAGLNDHEKARRSLNAYQEASGRFGDCQKSLGNAQGDEASEIAALLKETSDLKTEINLRSLQKGSRNAAPDHASRIPNGRRHGTLLPGSKGPGSGAGFDWKEAHSKRAMNDQPNTAQDSIQNQVDAALETPDVESTVGERISKSISSSVEFLTLSEGNLFLLFAVIIGLFSGLAVVCFRISIEWVRFALLGSALAPSRARVLVVPVVVGLVVAYLVQKFFPGARGSGVNQTKAAVYVFDGYVPFRTVVGKFITCALAIGSGQSLGPEDPSLQMGAGIASVLGRRLELSREKLRLLAPVGAAAGLAAAFNAPISAVLFVIEEVLGTWSAGALGAIVLAAVSSAVVMRMFLGGDALFRVPEYNLAHPAELLSYAVLGVVGGAVSVVLTEIIGKLRPRLRSLPAWTSYLQPAAAGLLIGFVALWIPQAMGAGYPYIDQALHNQYTWEMLALIGLAKIVTSSSSFVSGTPGGMFAPTLFIGAMIGGAVGGLEHHFFPQLSASVAPFALVGMGTLFAGFLRVPITSVFMVIETTGNYSIVLPVMISNTIAYLISRRFQKLSLFDMLARQDGLELPSMEEQREQVSLRVEDAMRKPLAPPLQGGDALARAIEIAGSSAEEVLMVRFPTGRWTTVRRDVLLKEAGQHAQDALLREVLPAGRVPVIHPDMRLDDVLKLIQGHEVLPVISRAGARLLLGVLTLPDILHAYQKGP